MNVAIQSESKPPSPHKRKKDGRVEAFGWEYHREGAGPCLPLFLPQEARTPPAKERSRQLEVVCIQFIFGLVTAQPWRKHSRKSPKLSGSLITELGLCRVRNKEAQHKRGLEGLSFERVYWTITEESLD